MNGDSSFPGGGSFIMGNLIMIVGLINSCML